MKVSLEVIRSNSNYNGLFSQNKIVSSGDHLYITYESGDEGSVILRYDGERWTARSGFPVGPPYIAVDSRGTIHLAGPHRKKRSEIWHFASSKPHDLETMGEGSWIHPKNYSSMVVDRRDDSLYYFGAGGNSGAIDYMRRLPDGQWTKRKTLVEGQVIYPAAIVRDGVLHLMFTGWEPNPALYQNIYYLRTADRGDTWMLGDGRVLKTPQTLNPWIPENLTALDKVNLSFGDGRADGRFACDVHQIKFFVDHHGRPHSLYGFIPSYFPTPEPLARYYTVHARRDAGGWKQMFLDPRIVSPSIVEDPKGRLHCLFTWGGDSSPEFNAGYMFSDDGGDHWSKLESVTCDTVTKASLGGVYWLPEPFRGRLCFVINDGSTLYFGTLLNS